MKKIRISKTGVASFVGKRCNVAANPAWVLDHKIWERAKKRAPGAPWGVVTNIYKKYGGRIGGQVGAHADEIELIRGIEVEKEHIGTVRFAMEQGALLVREGGTSAIIDAEKQIVQRIAQDHLREIPDYYTRLDRMEREAKTDLRPNVRPGLNWDAKHMYWYDSETGNAFYLDKGVLYAVAQNADGSFEWDNAYDPSELEEPKRTEIVKALRSKTQRF